MHIVQTPASMTLGCAGTLLTVGTLVSGFYMGHSQARGHQIDPAIHSMLKYGPTVLGGLLGFVGAVALVNEPENIEQIVQNAPSPEAAQAFRGCAPGCMVVGSTIGGVTFLTVANAIGYSVGYALGKQ